MVEEHVEVMAEEEEVKFAQGRRAPLKKEYLTMMNELIKN